MRSRLELRDGKEELSAALRESRGLLFVVALFSIFVNALMLTGPIFMLQIYDRVLGSRSVETLVALALLVGFLFLMMGILDTVRGRILARVGAKFQTRLEARVFSATLRSPIAGSQKGPADTAVRDLARIRTFLASPAFTALYDLPWTPIFIAGIYVFHPSLGILAFAGGAFLVLLTLVSQWSSRGPLVSANLADWNGGRLCRSVQDAVGNSARPRNAGCGVPALAECQAPCPD